MPNSFEKPPTAPPLESSAEQEKEPILRVLVSRHGPKLSAAGEKNQLAEYFDDHVKAGFSRMSISVGDKGLARISSSPVKRAEDTAKIYTEEISNTEHRTKDYVKRKEQLGVPFQPEGQAKDERFSEDLSTIVLLQAKLEPQIRDLVGQELSEASEEEKEAEIRNRIDMAVLAELFEDSARSDGENKFQTSADELADNFAKRYAGFSRHTKLLERLRSGGEEQPEGEPYVQVDVTHSFPSMAFLKKYLVFDDGSLAKDMWPEEFFSRTGGIIRESGNFQLDYVQDHAGIVKIEVTGEFAPDMKFSGTLDMERLSKLSPDNFALEKLKGDAALEGFYDGLYEQYNANEYKEFQEVQPGEVMLTLALNPNLTIKPSEEDVYPVRFEKRFRHVAMLSLELMSGAKQWAGISHSRLMAELEARSVAGEYREGTVSSLVESGLFEWKRIRKGNREDFVYFAKPELLRKVKELNN